MISVPSETWQMLAEEPGGTPIPEGLDAVWNSASGYLGRMIPRTARFLRHARTILALDEEFAEVTDADLKEKARTLKEIFRRGREQGEDLDRAFALVREAAFRTLGQKPYLVQVAGALAINGGCVAEMATGEGKTLTATMATVVAGWRGKGCHVLTANDYLAKRDAEWMRKVYSFCGLTVGHVEQEMDNAERRQNYLRDITYCTNKEAAADFLRDRLVLGRLRGLTGVLLRKMSREVDRTEQQLVQRGLHYAIVDEADSVLIDEAVTPLIISGCNANAEQVEMFQQAADIAGEMDAQNDYRVDDRFNEVELTRAGREKLDGYCDRLGGLWQRRRRAEEMVIQALTARVFYSAGKQYVIKDGDVVIVDEFTGRLMPDREWRDGLHQAVEAKEQLEVNSPKDTLARVSFQRFFRMYKKLSGMTGTAQEAAAEFWQIYNLPVAVIPTNRPCRRKMLADMVLSSENLKWKRIVEQVQQVYSSGRPVLVGTRSVHASELLSEKLSACGIEHSVLNAVNHEKEAQIVAEAGKAGKVTVATNMAGRGTDIKLGTGVAELGGLHVIATERHESGRIDRQLFGRCARQGDPGSAQAIVSMEDELGVRYGGLLGAVLRKRYGPGEREIRAPLARKLFDRAQNRAQRLALASRKAVMHTDNWLEENLGFAGRQ